MQVLTSKKGEFGLGSLALIALFFMAFLLFLNAQSEEPLDLSVEYDYFPDLAKTEEELPREGTVVPLDSFGLERDYVLEPNDLGFIKKYAQPVEQYTYMGPGIDGKLRPANSYLVGYTPFKTEQLWVPMVALANRLKYKRDFSVFSMRQDAWQTSRQAYRTRKGDCEDHSILLADWLIELGYDARVVVGMHNWEGHAWVVLFKDGKQYLIEATDKDKTQKFRPVRNTFAFRPDVMFNREYFWRNSGRRYLTSYSSGGWMKTSRFDVDEPIEDIEW